MYRGKVDLILGGCVILLIMLGQLMVFSASSMYSNQVYGTLFHFFLKQLLWGVVSIFLIIRISNFDYRKLNNEKTLIVMVIVTLVILVLVLFLGRTIKGATRWFSLGIVNFQPSEVAKITIIMFLAHKLSKRGIEELDFRTFLLPVYIIIGSIVLLIMIQPDLSTALMIAAISATMLFVSRVKLRYLFYTSLSMIPAVLFMMGRNNYQVRRVTNWLKSIYDPLMAEHQVKQSIVGIGRGGLLGNGLGESKQKLFFLPDSHTDFIFSIIGEEFGFLGASVILILFLIIMIRGMRIARNAPDGFGQFFALGVTVNISLYAFINVAVVSNLTPATGLPMPFISYGGSHLVFMAISVGLLLNISRHIRHGKNEATYDDFRTQRTQLNSTMLEVD